MRAFFLTSLIILCQACRHPLAIVGEGDIFERVSDQWACTLEQYQAGDVSCSENNIINRDYDVVYEAVPRMGWRFVEWRGTACGTGSQGLFCAYSVSKEWVEYVTAIWPDLDFPATIAVFAPLAPSGPLVIQGRATYTSIEATEHGLDYDNPKVVPVRGAHIELRNSAGATLQHLTTTDDGRFYFEAPTYSTLQIVLHAALGPGQTPDTLVVDNTAERKPYVLVKNIETIEDHIEFDIHAKSGWSGQGYTDSREAAPFAILDVAYQAQSLVRKFLPDALFPPLIINWSPNNSPASGSTDVASGHLPSSFYSGGTNGSGELFILGAQNIDTDEYDASVIAHEWVHYFEASFSRSDSPGGSHNVGDLLDPALSFSEGLANAMSAMIIGQPKYIDTSGPRQSEIKAYVDVDTDRFMASDVSPLDGQTTLDGFYSESSVGELIYDIFDGGVEDDDVVNLGSDAILKTLMQGLIKTSAVTTIFSFLDNLKEQYPEFTAAIDELAAAQNIGTGDEFESADQPFYIEVPADGTLIRSDLTGSGIATSDLFGAITPPVNGGNNWLNRVYFRGQTIVGGCHSISAYWISGGTLRLRSYDLVSSGGGAVEFIARPYLPGELFSFTVAGSTAGTRFSVSMAPSADCTR